MNWKESKLVGAIALVLVAASAVVLVMLAKGSKSTGPKISFICDSTGEVFTVYAIPGDTEYEENYLVGTEEAVPCKVPGCGKKDAYAAFDFGGGNYVRIGFRTFICQSTGTTFVTPESRRAEGYERDYARAPYQEALVCKICKQIDAYRAGVDESGRWIVGVEPEPEEGLEGERALGEGESFVMPIDRALIIEEVKELSDRREAERKAQEAPGGDSATIEGEEAATEGEEAATEPAQEAPGG